MTNEREMTHDKRLRRGAGEDAAPAAGKPSPAARRALAEAKARRREYLAKEAESSPEWGGRGGKDPARYGDWEIKGKAVDF